MTDENRPDANEEALNQAPETEIEDPIGDETDGEAGPAIESEEDIEAAEDEAEEEAEDEPGIDDEDESDEDDADSEDDGSEETDPEVTDETAEEDQDEPEFTPKPRPPVKLERLQKILAQSGVASRRKAEEMIEQGRVQVNGKVVTELGTKADAGRDHIRVDGKLLHGAERLRYFVLNKPRGFVTTVKDPEGRPTVMQFFDKMRERLYPVGRLDYLSEGLLLVTNDGELANKLTRAAAGVEKTYLVKVAGIPSEGELDILRAGVAIEKGKPGSGKVRTSPARIRQVRQGDNPWYEVVLIEGRNRELRKMFEEIGHFVEKIRRVGYGPLILDQEPGNLRELDENELTLLRKAADGTLRTPKAKEIRRRNMIDSLPPEKPAFKARGAKPAYKPGFKPAAGPKDYQPKKSFDAKPFSPKPFGAKPYVAKPFDSDRPSRGASGPARPSTGAPRFSADSASSRPAARPAWKKDSPATGGAGARGTGRPPARFTPRPGSGSGAEERPSGGKPYSDRPAGRTFGSRPPAGRTFGDKPAGRTFGAKPGGKPAWKKPDFSGKPPAFKRPAPTPIEDDEPRKSFKLHIEPVQDSERSENTRGSGARPSRGGSSRPSSARPSTARPSTGRPPYGGGQGRTGSGPARSSGRPPMGREGAGRSGPPSGRPSSARPSSGRTDGPRSSSPRPFSSEGGLPRAFTTSSGKPRPGGARPSSKPGASDRPKSGPRASGPSSDRRTGTGWKPKPAFGGKPSFGGKPGASARPKSGPKAGGFSKSGPKGSTYKGKAGGANRTGSPRPGGKKPGGKRPY